jgi:hypothetical protein
MDSSGIPPQDGYGVIARLYWMFFGLALLPFLLVYLFQNRPAFPAPVDLACLLVVGSLVAVRYVDVRYLSGRTAEGELATTAHWRRYAQGVCVVGVGVWFAARVSLHFVAQ